MKVPGYVEARFTIPEYALDLCAGTLWEMATLGFEVAFARQHGWVCVIAYFPRASQPASLIERLMPRLEVLCESSGCPADWRKLAPEAWEANWKTSFQPVEVGQRLVILPSWSRRSYTGRHVVRIRPRTAFGTGGHETTRLCLEALAGSIQPGLRLADIGTGSGILALVGLRLGASSVDACDTDPIALQNARWNARLNRAGCNFRLFSGNVASLPERPLYHRVVANLTVDPLAEDMGGMAVRLRRGGLLHVSGLLASQERPLRPSIRKAGLVITDRKEQNQWVLLTCRKA